MPFKNIFFIGLFILTTACQSVQARNGKKPIDSYRSQVDWQPLKNGIEYSYMANQFSSNVHLVKVDLDNPSIKVSLSKENEKGKTPADQGSRVKASVSINASFFDGSYNPRGITITEGNPWNNVLYAESSPFFYCTVEMECEINHDGSFDIESSWYTAAGGLHSLLRNGKMRTKQDDKNCGSFCTYTHPRTAIGLSRDNSYLILALAEGRKKNLRGLTLEQMSMMMHYAGAYQSFNLDGGGSSTLVIDGKLISARPDREPQQRRVANSILIISN